MSEKVTSKPSPPDGEQDAPGHRARRAQPIKLNPAFDAWLETQLHQIFDAASTEPLPNDLVKLLEKMDQAEAAAKAKAKDKA
jgi:hypothetical protein